MTPLALVRSRKGKIDSHGGELLRLDTRGRVRTGRERREMLLAEFDRSGVSGARFARMTGINYQTFCPIMQRIHRWCTQLTDQPLP